MIQTIDAEEQIVKRVVESGTGGIVYAPRKWLGQEVIVILPKQPGDIKERLIGILGPKLEHVIGIYLTGSYARNESAKDSDIDILVISDSKFELPSRHLHHPSSPPLFPLKTYTHLQRETTRNIASNRSLQNTLNPHGNLHSGR